MMKADEKIAEWNFVRLNLAEAWNIEVRTENEWVEEGYTEDSVAYWWFTIADSIAHVGWDGSWQPIIDTIEPHLSPPTSSIITQGLELKALLQSIQAPREFETYHQDILNCVDSEIERGKGILGVLEGRPFGDIDVAACDTFDFSMNKIRELWNAD